MLIDALAGDPHLEPMRLLVQEADRALQEAQRIGAATGLLAGPLPWWEAWQRRYEAGAAAPSPAGETPLAQAKRFVREGEARIARQRALLAHINVQDHPLLVQQAQTLLHGLMRAQLLVKARLLMLQHFKN